MKYPHLFSRIDMTNNLNFKFFKTYLKETNSGLCDSMSHKPLYMGKANKRKIPLRSYDYPCY
jgi:hypothetical protein